MRIDNIYTTSEGTMINIGQENKTRFILHFDEDVNQENDEPLDTINDLLIEFFSFGVRELEDVDIDWRDDREVWVTVG